MITVEEARKMMNFNYEEALKYHENAIDTKIEIAAKDERHSISYNSSSKSMNAELANRYRKAGFTVTEYVSPFYEIKIEW